MTGQVWGVGTGPGDPELLTRKAARLIGEADAIFYVEADGKPSRALATAAAFVPEAADRCAIHLPMRPDPADADAAYALAVQAINRRAAAGQTVAVLCEGDPLLYGSFIHLMAGLEVRPGIVPGIPAFLAGAAALPKALVRRSGSLALLPGTLAQDELRRRLVTADCAVIYKTGRHFANVRGALTRAGFAEARIIIEASDSAEQVVDLAHWRDSVLPYFALILAWREGAL